MGRIILVPQPYNRKGPKQGPFLLSGAQGREPCPGSTRSAGGVPKQVALAKLARPNPCSPSHAMKLLAVRGCFLDNLQLRNPWAITAEAVSVCILSIIYMHSCGSSVNLAYNFIAINAMTV